MNAKFIVSLPDDEAYLDIGENRYGLHLDYFIDHSLSIAFYDDNSPNSGPVVDFELEKEEIKKLIAWLQEAVKE